MRKPYKKTTNFNEISDQEIYELQEKINNMSRKILLWKSSNEKFKIPQTGYLLYSLDDLVKRYRWQNHLWFRFHKSQLYYIKNHKHKSVNNITGAPALVTFPLGNAAFSVLPKKVSCTFVTLIAWLCMAHGNCCDAQKEEQMPH